MATLDSILGRAARGDLLSGPDVRALARLAPSDPAAVIAAAGEVRDAAYGARVTYSKKVFIPLTKLCRDSCGYCTFAHPPRPGERAYMSIDEVLEVAHAGERAGCKEALFTLGDKPERKWAVARDELAGLGYDSTIDYLA